jgi:hypothetical protein
MPVDELIPKKNRSPSLGSDKSIFVFVLGIDFFDYL